MRFLLVNRYFAGQQVPTGRMLRDLALALSELGHTVRIVTSNGTYLDKEVRAEIGRHMSVTYLWTGKKSRRIFSWLSFWLQVCLRVPLMDWDRCVLLTDPPFMPVAAWLARMGGSRGRKAYWWTMDLYPEALVASNLIRSGGLVHRFLVHLNELGLRAVRGVICLGERQRQRLQVYRSWRNTAGFCLIVPPWDARSILGVERAANRFLAQYGWQECRIALYAGNLGEAHRFQEILNAARYLSERGDSVWKFVFAVRGSNRAALEAESVGLANVVVLDYQPAELTADLLGAAAIHLISMNSGWEGVVVPSKLYGALQTDAPVLFIGPPDADTANEIRKDGAGRTLPVGCDGRDVALALEELYQERPRKGQSQQRKGVQDIARFLCGE